jgi:mono/diheme cytochrome c family protein
MPATTSRVLVSSRRADSLRAVAANARVLVAIAAASLVLSSCGARTATEPVPPSEARTVPAEPLRPIVDVGRSYFRQYCASCHGIEGHGDGPVAPVLVHRPEDLATLAARRGGVFPAAEVASAIDGRARFAAHGSPEMPVWGRRFGKAVGDDATGQEIVRGRVLILVEYLRSLQQP